MKDRKIEYNSDNNRNMNNRGKWGKRGRGGYNDRGRGRGGYNENRRQEDLESQNYGREDRSKQDSFYDNFQKYGYDAAVFLKGQRQEKKGQLHQEQSKISLQQIDEEISRNPHSAVWKTLFWIGMIALFTCFVRLWHWLKGGIRGGMQ